MDKKAKIVVIGAGSMSFGLACLQDAYHMKELWGSTLAFVDKNAEALDRMLKVAERMNNELGAGFKLLASTNLREVMKDADFVIVSIAVNRLELWKQDFYIPQKHGVKHILGENGGPGAIFHTMRNVPLILDICRDMEQLCPEALLINFTNPESRICLAVRKYTKIKAVGLCHQIAVGVRMVGHITGVDASDIDVKAAGINHFTWMKDLRRKSTGEDLYPLLREKEQTFDPGYEKLSRYFFRKFGLFPTSGDGHLGEFIPFALEMIRTEEYKFEGNQLRREKFKAYMDGLIDGSIRLDWPAHIWNEEDNMSMLSPSGEIAFDVVRGILCNTNAVLLSANLPNEGYLTNLPSDAIVEVPAIVSGLGVTGLGMGDLPRPIASMLRKQIDVQHLNVDAAVTGDREIALQALLTDPCVPGPKAAEGMLDELLELQKEYLPQFK